LEHGIEFKISGIFNTLHGIILGRYK